MKEVISFNDLMLCCSYDFRLGEKPYVLNLHGKLIKSFKDTSEIVPYVEKNGYEVIL